MSRIYFHSQSGEAEVRGSERAYGAHLINDMFQTALGVSDYHTPENPHVLRNIIHPSHYCLRETGKRFAETFSTALAVCMETPLLWVDGNVVETFAASLNTGLVMGSAPIMAYARLHGQCEIHAFIEGRNRGWFAKILQQGLLDGIMRSGVGWEETITMLGSRNDEPVVTSYSVCEQFPNPHATGWKPSKVDEDGEADWDAWYEIPESEQWEMGMKALRASKMLEIRPRDWKTFYFNDGWTGFKLLAKAIEISKQRDAAQKEGQ